MSLSSFVCLLLRSFIDDDLLLYKILVFVLRFIRSSIRMDGRSEDDVFFVFFVTQNELEENQLP